MYDPQRQPGRIHTADYSVNQYMEEEPQHLGVEMWILLLAFNTLLVRVFCWGLLSATFSM